MRRALQWVHPAVIRSGEEVFTEEMGRRRRRSLQVVCMDTWAAYANLVREHAPQAQILFVRFPIVKHLHESVDAVRREMWRQLTSKDKVEVKGTRWLLLKNPWNLTNDQQERLSTLVRWNSPLARAWYLREFFQLFWSYKQPKRAEAYLRKWIHSRRPCARSWSRSKSSPVCFGPTCRASWLGPEAAVPMEQLRV